MRPPHKRRNEGGGSGPKSRASNNQLHLIGNSFDPRTGSDGGGTAIVSGLTVGTSGQDINLNSTSITNGQTVTISTGTITAPAPAPPNTRLTGPSIPLRTGSETGCGKYQLSPNSNRARALPANPKYLSKGI
jgi:hypothetical protein